MSQVTETETVVKKILPYLIRRGYDLEKDLSFEKSVKTSERYTKGYVDILVTCGKAHPLFLIEAKRLAKSLTQKDRDQAIEYATALRIPFVVVTNGNDVQCFNTHNRKPIRWNGKLSERIPTKSQLPLVLRALKSNKESTDIALDSDCGLPFRPGLALKQINALFARCHNTIRKIEKNEEHAFADFSKLLFLKLLEEKADTSEFSVPYSYRFHDLSERPQNEADQVQAAVTQMIELIKRHTTYGEVLEDPLYLKKPATFLYIVKQLAAVSFYDSSLDSKGAAFEYFVRATLKGKKLGQYFTPRPLIQLVSSLVGQTKILEALRSSSPIKVHDPACGTGGFLVYLLQDNLNALDTLKKNGAITKATLDTLSTRLKREVFFGTDANPGVACAAKMNMIIAGDGHTNIQCQDGLADTKHWTITNPQYDLVLTNPPFGTSESESLTDEELAKYPIRSLKGQHLFLQKMVLCTKPEGEICTVIDEGVLNTDSATPLRKWILQKCQIRAVVRLPDETFKPNKINVRSSLLYLLRREDDDTDLDTDYPVTFCDLSSLGYQGSGDPIRGFNFQKLLQDCATEWLKPSKKGVRIGDGWQVFQESSQSICSDRTHRLDVKYWQPEIRKRTALLEKKGGVTIKSLNQIATSRGKSPPEATYVDEKDGYALVVKAGSSISKFGTLIEGGDYIEKNLYDEFVEKAKEEEDSGNLVFKGDVLLASTGDGTLGKCCVYTSDTPAIADGHVTVIRVNPRQISPQYLCDYLRCGFGAAQVERLYTGSTGLIELTPTDVDRVVVNVLDGVDSQKNASQKLRKAEQCFIQASSDAETQLLGAREAFRG